VEAERARKLVVSSIEIVSNHFSDKKAAKFDGAISIQQC
jgi:hypothetical protein